MSTRCKTHLAESSSTEEKPGGLNRHAFDSIPPKAVGQFPPSWLSGLFYLRRTGRQGPMGTNLCRGMQIARYF